MVGGVSAARREGGVRVRGGVRMAGSEGSRIVGEGRMGLDKKQIYIRLVG